jgi:hypothetical protein
MKNMYEIFDEFEQAKSKKDRMVVIERNLNPTLVEVLRLTYHPNFQWYVEDMPENYIVPMDTRIPGLGRTQLSTDLRKLYLFQKGNPTADKLTPRKRNELLLQMLETLEPREAEVVAGIFRKDQCVNGLDYKFVKEAFPQLLP